MRAAAVAFLMGVLFAAGLALAGMTDPAKVIAFLDVRGAWDPSLAFVMGGAVGVTFFAFPAILRRGKPVLEPRFLLPKAASVDARLVAGASLFGVGWGLSGLCPGPALVALVSLRADLVAFVAAMAVSSFVVRTLEKAHDQAFVLEEVD